MSVILLIYRSEYCGFRNSKERGQKYTTHIEQQMNDG